MCKKKLAQTWGLQPQNALSVLSPNLQAEKFNLSFCPTFCLIFCLYYIFFQAKKLHCKEYTAWITNNKLFQCHIYWKAELQAQRSLISSEQVVLNASLPWIFILFWRTEHMHHWVRTYTLIFCISGKRAEDTFTEPGNNVMLPRVWPTTKKTFRMVLGFKYVPPKFWICCVLFNHDLSSQSHPLKNHYT